MSITASVDWYQEYGTSHESVFDLFEPVWIAPSSGPDVALLRIREKGRAGQALPAPIELMSKEELEDLKAREGWIAVVGYPAYDTRNDAADQQRLFDGVYNDIANAEGFAAEARQSKAFGFDGKTLIHPSQVEPCNAIFAPPAEAVQQARDVIAAFADPANSGKGVLKVNGRMTELLHLAQAKRMVAVAEAIAARESAS